jgi:hypothetical protein
MVDSLCEPCVHLSDLVRTIENPNAGHGICKGCSSQVVKGAVQITSRTLRSACLGAVFAEEQGEESHGGLSLASWNATEICLTAVA